MSIEAINITKRFGNHTTALKGVNLNVESGELVALLGPSGSGKTTLLRIIAGLESSDEGRILFHGNDATNVRVRHRQVGFVFQHYALFRHMTVFDNIAFGLRVRPRKERPSKEEIAKKVRKLLSLVQLNDLEKRYPTQLSGGQRQRVALARALAIDPKVLLLDEPFGALDARVRKDLRRWLRNIHEELKVATVFVTHDQEEALEIADRVVVMNNATIEQVGTPREVYDHPSSPFVCQFLGNVNALNAAVKNGKVTFGELELPIDSPSSRNGSEALAFVRPHEIEISRIQNGSPSLEAIIEMIHAAGPIAKLDLRLKYNKSLLEVEIPRSLHDELGLNTGDSAFVKFRNVKSYPVQGVSVDSLNNLSE